MKHILKRLMTVVFLAAIFGSCTKQLLDINTSPNDPTTASATPDLVLSAALQNMAVQYSNPTADARFAFAALWMGHISYSGNYAIATENISYAITNNFAAGAFGNIYDIIEDFDFVEKKGAETGNNFYRGIGILMKAYNYQTLVDLYGNVPYTDALKGTDASKPKYDDQKAIYDDLGKKMDTAIALLKTSVTGSIGGDVMFKGNAPNWVKFANTVKLRLLIRQSQKADRAAYIAAEVAKLAGASFLDVDATVNPGYLNSAGKTNPFWGSNVNTSGTYTQDFYRAGQYAIDFFKNHGDTLRMKRFYTGVGKDNIDSMKKFYPNASYQGNYFGDQGLTNSKTSGFGYGLLNSFSQSAPIMTAAESYFLQAEAIARGWLAGGAAAAKTAYQNGVKKSFTFLGLTEAQATTYYSQAGDKQVNWDATTNLSEQIALIIRQKWAALTGLNELEPYNDYRRLKLPPDVPLSLSPFSTGKMPTRLLYPQRENEVNAESVQAVGTITPTTNVWWMP